MFSSLMECHWILNPSAKEMSNWCNRFVPGLKSRISWGKLYSKSCQSLNNCVTLIKSLYLFSYQFQCIEYIIIHLFLKFYLFFTEG